MAAAKPRAKRRTNWVAGKKDLDFLDDMEQEDKDKKITKMDRDNLRESMRDSLFSVKAPKK